MSAGRIHSVIITAIIFIACVTLTGCDPALPLNPKYSYTSFDLELGQDIASDIAEYVDMSGMSPEEESWVRDNTEVLYDGKPADGQEFRDAGEHELTIMYRGRQYRRYNITVTDKEPPVFTAAQDVYTFEGIPVEQEDLDAMFSAEDNSGKVRVRVKPAEVDYDTEGTYTVKATATDPSGNKTTARANIIVQRPEYGAIGTYVYVDIDRQHLTYFEDGKVIMDCPVVTGNIYTGHGTPRGTFRLTYKSRNVTLKGREDNGDEYESFVSYWMAFIGSSVGMHDATWRSTFGGSIYRGAGSHGCVNMPYASAAELYDLLGPETLVFVY